MIWYAILIRDGQLIDLKRMDAFWVEKRRKNDSDHEWRPDEKNTRNETLPKTTTKIIRIISHFIWFSIDASISKCNGKTIPYK